MSSNAGITFDKALEHHKKGELSPAETLYKQLLAQEPNHTDALVNLATIVYNHDPQQCFKLLRKARQLAPDSPFVHFNLGNLFQRHGFRDKAIKEFREVIRLQPENSEAYFRLGVLLSETGKPEDALFCYQKAFRQKPDDARILNNLTEVLNRLNRFDEAKQMAQEALTVHPDLVEAYGNLGNVFKEQGNYKKAAEHFKKALELRPDDARIQYHLGATLLFSNRHKEASEYLQKAIDSDPYFHQAHSSLVYALNYLEEPSREDIFEAHKQWGAQHGTGAKDTDWDWIKRDPLKKLKVGFVSPDFRAHVVALFTQQLFQHYDKEQFAFFGYAEVERPDTYTSKFMGLSDAWRSIIGINDEEVYQIIQNDQIDILIDLAGHSAGNRLKVFAMKPAPIQISWLGYINTTGLQEMDYRFTDVWVNPPETQAFYTEELVYLPNSFTCYEPVSPCPAVSETPALENGYVTFGCFNNTNKLSAGVIKAWSNILHRVPGSKLLLKSSHLADDGTVERFKNQFKVHGIPSDRLIFEGPSEIYDYLASYSKIDIALDPFPHNGGTTSHDALWMGVPLVTLQGDRYVGRFGVSILNNLGHPEWIGSSKKHYTEIAVHLTKNVEHLNQIRQNLRQEMASSPLCDGPAFSQHFGEALRKVWKKFCGTASALH